MRKIVRKTVLAGVAIVALAGAALGLANDKRTMTVGLPDGSLARIEYKGNVPPKIAIEPASQFVPIIFADRTMFSPFSIFDQIAADMDLQAMLNQTRLIEAAAVKGRTLNADRLPAGTMSYHFVAMSTQNGTCSRSVEMASFGPSQQPKVVSSSSGNCDNAAQAPTPAVTVPGKSLSQTKTV